MENNLHVFDITSPLIYNWTGKFETHSKDWIHLTRTLYDYELIVVTKGTLYIAANEEKYTVTTNSYIILPPLALQYGWKSSSCSFYWLHFAQNEGEIKIYDSSCLNKEYRTCDNGQIRTNYLTLPLSAALPFPERVIILFQQLHDSERRYENKSYNDFLITSILLELKNQLIQQNSDSKLKKTKQQLCDDIKEYIHWHIGEPITVNQIANYYGYNCRYLTTIFKQITGYSLKNYILKEKIEQAKLLLSDTEQNISQIGYSIGFNDNHNFSSCFKKMTGLSPSRYRESFAKHMRFYE